MTSTKQVLAGEVWSQLLTAARGPRDRFLGLAAENGLSPGDLRTLLSLGGDRPRTMGDLAAAWRCDASYVTAMVDRLESRGLVERRPSADDRRVKAVALTAAGATLRTQVADRLHRPPEGLLGLDRATLSALRDGLVKLNARD